MDSSILNIEQATEFLGVSEKTLIKLLREEHIPARKIGREWRISKEALLKWLAEGDSCDYINNSSFYQYSEDENGSTENLLDSVCKKIETIKKNASVNEILDIKKNIDIPESGAKLRVSYKQQRDLEKLEFKVYWPIRDNYKID